MKDRIAVVTGAGSGIGRAAALALNADGWHVVVVGRRIAALNETVTLSADPSRTFASAADVADEAAVERAFAAIRDRYDRLDLLFNNAGTGAPAKPLDELTFAEWKAVVDVNLNGMFLCARAAIRLMKAQEPKGGRIINNGSIAATSPRPLSAAYTATKHAVTGLTKSIALDYRNDNIACGQIDIGNAGTDMTEKMAQGILQADGSIRPEPRMDVAHVGSAICHMARLPLDANVMFMTLMATNMPFVGRG
jgi:NAD(P)-dependent dehydrogenase (short-subunit alcohol dehydrogenase family)